MVVSLPPSDPLPWRKRPWVVLWMISLGQLISWGTVYYTFPLFVAPMEKELGWSRTELNAALTCGLIAGALCAIPVGAWIDRYGGRAVMTLGSLAAAALYVVWAKVDQLWLFYALWIPMGMTQAAILYEPAFTVVRQVFREGFQRPLVALTLVGGLASTWGMPVTEWLIRSLGWRDALLCLAAMNAAVVFVVHLPFLPGPAERKAAAPEPKSRDALRAAMKLRAFWGLAVAFAAYGLVASAVAFHLIPMLAERGVPMDLIIAITVVIGPMQVLGRVLLLPFGRSATSRRIGSIVYLCFPIGTGILAFGAAGWTGLLAFAIPYGVANGLVTILRGISIPELISPHNYGAIGGAISMPSALCRAVAPLAAALLWTWAGGYGAVAWALCGLTLVSALGFAVAAWPSKRTA